MAEEINQDKDVKDLLSLLQKDKSLRMFREALSQDDLEAFAHKARIIAYDQGEQVITQGERATYFFILMEGQLRAVDVSHEPPQLMGYLFPGDTAGVRALIENRVRTATVEVVIASKIAVFDEDVWYWLIGKNSQIRDFFEDLEKSRAEQSKRDFPGRQFDEVIVVSTKRHVIAFIATLPLPLTLLIAPILFILAEELLGLGFLTAVFNYLTLFITLPFFIASILLLVYNYFDWRNDDFIVTTKRVIHIERILFFGEQRRDAPLTRIQDVTAESDVLDYIVDSDNLRITTAGTGVLFFDHIRDADRVRQAIFRERERAKARVAAADVAALRRNIADQLNWEDKLEQNVIPVAEAEAYLTDEPETHHYGRFLDYFIPRMKEVTDTGSGTIVMWRKHYFVLFTNIIWPTLLLILAIFLFLSSIILWIPPFTLLSFPLQLGLFIVILFCFGWYIWEYDDWRKDVYMVTNTQIIDIDSAAFRLRRTRREGTFDNIQGVYSEVPNIFYKLINLGSVIIETAGTEETFTFKKVFDPASVTKEVFNRWSLYQQRERESRRDSTHSQVMEVLREYHYLSNKENTSTTTQV